MGNGSTKMRRNKGVTTCEDKTHVYVSTQYCDRDNCKKRICDNCYYLAKDQENKYCQMCTLSVLNQEQGQDISEADEMAFAEENKDSNDKFSMTKVKRDMVSGEI